MNIATARKLHERRFRASPIMTTGELLSTIGSDGLQEALNNRWVVADQDTGFLTLNMNGGKLLELENACRCQCGKLDCACASQNEAAPRTLSSALHEDFKGFGLPAPAKPASETPTGTGGGPQVIMPRPQAAQAPTAPAPKPTQPGVGENVTVEENGKTYNGTVAGIGQDGRYRLNFGNARPAMNRDYSPNELRKTPPSA